MPKIVDYPRASLKNSLELADAVDSMGGTCTVQMAAERSGKKVSGAFSALVGAAVKYGLVESKDSKLSVTPVYRNIKLAYTEGERQIQLRKALLSAPLFQAIAQRFNNKALPVEHFEKLLMREFGVPDGLSSRVSMYFLDGAKQAGALGEDNVLRATEDLEQFESSSESNQDFRAETTNGNQSSQYLDQSSVHSKVDSDTRGNEYSVAFRGPGLNSTIIVRDAEDLLIVDAMLKKVKKALEIEKQ
jgi:hypothetical protein